MKKKPNNKFQGEYPEMDSLPPTEARPGRRPTYGEPMYYAGAAYGGEPGGMEERGLDLFKLVRILLRRWHTPLIFLILGGLGGWLVYQRATPVYRAQAELEMSVRSPKVINSQAIYDDNSFARDTDAIITTRFAKFRSPAMERMATTEYQKRFPKDERSGKALASSVRRVKWSKDEDSNIVRVTASGVDPEFIANIVNTLSFSAGALMVQENQAMSDGAVQWLTGQVEEARESLSDVELELGDARKKAQLDSLSQKKAALGEALKEVTTARSMMENQLEARRTTYEFVTELVAEKLDFERLPTGLPKEEQISLLIAEWRTAKNQLLMSKELYTEQHPEYKRLQRAEELAREQVNDFFEVTAEAVRNELRLLEKQFARLNQRVEEMEQNTIAMERDLVSNEQKLIGLERRREAADDAYRALLRRMEQARMAADENMAFINVIREASVPTRPVSPIRFKMLSSGLFIGLLVGCGLAFLLEFWSDKIMLVGDLKDMGLNILGTIPTQKTVGDRGDLATIGLKDKFSHVFEIFAGINTLISSERYKDRTKVLLVCSVMPGEGKTISSSNIAINSAMNGTRTLLIDGDLRRPRLANVFDIAEDHASLLEWLSAEEQPLSPEELVISDLHENLDIISSRPHREVNPAELMGRDRLRELFDWARANYDRVIIDSPPLGLVGDTQALANQADSVIVVSRLGKTKKRSLRFALGRLVELDANVLGCIANDVPHSLSGMFKGGGYGHYGYGGYGSYKSYGREEEA